MEDITNKFGVSGYVDSRIGGRAENQDSYGFADTPLGLLVAVCDGMGGGPAGKTASELAKDTIIGVVCSCKPQDNPERILTSAVEAANSALIGAIRTNPSLQGMGTTCVALLLNRKHAYIAHVGDSRCYVLRGGKVAFRTADHSYVGELVRKGELTEEQARQSSHSNVITRAIGVRPTVEAEIDKVGVKPGDRFALMTDGIWGAMQEQHLVGSLCSDEELPLVVAELADRVDAMGHNNGGKHDNMTLAVVDYPAAAKQASANASFSLSPNDAPDMPSSHGKTARKTRPMWPLLCLLIFSVGMNAYLLLQPKSTDSKNSQQVSVPKENPQKNIDSLNRVIDSLNSENSILRNSLEEMENARRVKPIASVPDKAHDKDKLKDKDKGKGGYHLNDRQRLLQDAINILSQLDTLGQKGNLKPNVAKQKRKAKQAEAGSQVASAAILCSSEKQRQIVGNLGTAIKNDAKIGGIDRQGRPTKEAKDKIKEYISLIKEINE